MRRPQWRCSSCCCPGHRWSRSPASCSEPPVPLQRSKQAARCQTRTRRIRNQEKEKSGRRCPANGSLPSVHCGSAREQAKRQQLQRMKRCETRPSAARRGIRISSFSCECALGFSGHGGSVMWRGRARFYGRGEAEEGESWVDQVNFKYGRKDARARPLATRSLQRARLRTHGPQPEMG